MYVLAQHHINLNNMKLGIETDTAEPGYIEEEKEERGSQDNIHNIID